MKFYFQEFLNDLAWFQNYSSHTLRAYKKDLEIYREFKLSHFKDFYEFLKQKGLHSRSQARIISCVRSYSKFCQRKSLKKEEEPLKLPVFSQKLPYPLSVLDFSKLIQASSTPCPHRKKRNHLVLKILFGCGLRASELVNLNRKDYRPTESALCVLGKGKKERLIPLTELINKDLRNYIKESLDTLSEDPQALFVNNKKKRLHRVDLWRWIKVWSKKAQISSKISPHKFRHGCATILLENGADLRTIQTLLGHSHLSTTEIYTHITQNKLNEDIQKHHPLSLLKIKKLP